MAELPVLYHGTTTKTAKRILKEGFRRGSQASYTGTGVNLSEQITVSYEYGEYENGGGVLEVRLRPDTKYEQLAGISVQDSWFDQHPDMQAVCLFGGNVWVVWDVAAIESVRLLTHDEALRLLVSAFLEDGPQCGYNGVAQDYASVVHNQPDPNLDRFPGEREKLAAKLKAAEESKDLVDEQEPTRSFRP